MGQKKLQRFAEFKTFSNALEYPADMKGQWGDFFKNDHPITLELACGKGEYAVSLGRLHKDRNFIGVDIKANRMWVGAKKALNEGLHNVAFLRSQIERIDEFFSMGEVDEIWITFPDPQLNISRAKKRLTHPRFLRLFQNILQSTGTVHLKTDSPDLYRFTKKVINYFGFQLLIDYEDLYKVKDLGEELLIKTHYEQLDIAKSSRIHYLKFKIEQMILAEKEEQFKKLISEEGNNGTAK